jgi:hypothetical protein
MADGKPYQVLYDYSDVPTIRRFALDNTRIRCLIGPFGSGKSSGCVQEIIRRSHMQEPGPDGIRRTRWAVVRNCYDDQTEVLTETRGWKLFKNISYMSDRIASLVDDKELVFVYPVSHYQSQYTGEMIGYKNQKMDFLVTPDHRLYASMINGRTKKMYGYKLHKASDIYGMTHYRFKTNADEYNGGESEYSEKMFEFLGFWFAEGYVGKYPRKDTIGYHWRFIVTQKENEEYVANLLRDCKFGYGKNKGGGSAYNYSIYITDREKGLIEKLLVCGKARTKCLPEWIKQAPRAHLQAFLYGYEVGDGHTRVHKNDSTRLFTSSEKLANDLQEIIIKIGGSASLNKDSNGMFALTIHQPNQYMPQTQVKRGWYKQDYDGMIYCVEVPSHVIVTRRNNKVLMNSQSYLQLKDTTIKTFCDWYPPKIFGEFRVTDHTFLLTKFPGIHSEILFRALDRPDQVSNLLSLELTGAWFNEVREIPWSIVEAMDSRIGRYPSARDGGASWYGIIMDTNPPEDGATLYRIAEVTKPDNFKVFKQPSGLSAKAENTKFLPKNYYKNLAKGKSEMYIRVYIHGQYGFMLLGEPVFQSFNDSYHVAPYPLDVDKSLPVYIGMDFSIVGCLIGQLTPLGQLRIIDELTSEGLMGIRQFCLNRLLPLLRTKYFGMAVSGFGDMSGLNRTPTDESTCFDILHSQEIGLSGIDSAPTNALAARIDPVEHFLLKGWKGEPGLLISPTCKILRKAMNGGYYYEQEKKSNNPDEHKLIPVKNYSSHIADALEYLCMFLTNKEGDDVRRQSFLSQLKRKDYRPASEISGY